MLIVGYDVDDETGEEYFLIKHNQGESFGGYGGYIRVTTSVAKESKGVCGILTPGNLFQVLQS